MRNRLLFIFFIVISLMACNIPRYLNSDSTYEYQDNMQITQTSPVVTFSPIVVPTTTMTFTSISTQNTNTPEPGFGSISGQILGYPYGEIPRLIIVAIEQPFNHYWYLILPLGSTYYSMDGYISTGRYQIVAYDDWGHRGGCLTVVEVRNGEMVTCDISDWTGVYPAKPSGVP